MAVSKTGSTYDGDGSGQDFSVGSITVPSDADICIVCIAYEGVNASAEALTGDLSWDDGNTNDFTTIQWADGDTYPASGAEAHYMLSSDGNWPGSGSGKTLYFGLADSPDYNTAYSIFFLKGVDTSTPIGDTGTDTNNDGSTNVDFTITLSPAPSTGDWSFVITYHWGTSPTMDTGQTQITDHRVGGAEGLFVSYEDGESAPGYNSADYPIGVAWVVNASSAVAPEPSINDSITVQEDVSVLLKALNINVNDLVSIEEALD